MADYLDSLVNIIASNVKILGKAYGSAGEQFPSLTEDRDLLGGDASQEATRLIIAAAAQLLASVRTPVEILQEGSAGMYNTTVLAFANNYNIADVLKEAGAQGLHVEEIGQRIGIKGSVVARCLRYLATRHIFREVTPNVFANNRISLGLLKKKPFADIEKNPMTKYDGATISAIVGHTSDEGFMGSHYFADFLKDSKGYASPFNMAIKNNTNMFDWYEIPGNEWRGHRFAAAMKISSLIWKPELIASALDWNALPAGSIVADVGGNIGLVTQVIARVAPQHQYIIQDLEGGITEAKRHWAREWPEAIINGLVKLEVHSFFEPMTIAADVYILRAIIHDWPVAECQKIMELIHIKAKKTSKLVLFEMIAGYACPAEASEPSVPYPLLANMGIAGGGFVTMADMQMWTLFNSQERTLEEFTELGNSTGWKLEAVKPGPLAALIFVKVTK